MRTALMTLAERWANEAGLTLDQRGTPADAAMLTNQNAALRALWRCAHQLADLLNHDPAKPTEPQSKPADEDGA